MIKYGAASFIAFGALLGVSAQAEPMSPGFVQTQVKSGDAVQKVWHRWHHRRWGSGWSGWGHSRPRYRNKTE